MAHPLLTTIDGQKANGLLALSLQEQKFLERNRRYFNGDHWLDGLGYIGPSVAKGNSGTQEVMLRIQNLFCSKNVVKEIILRQVSANLGRAPDIAINSRQPRKKIPKPDFTPPADRPDAEPPLVDEPFTTEQQQAIADAVSALKVFLKDAGAAAAMKRAAKARLWGGRSYLRVFIPQAKLKREYGSLAEAIQAVVVDYPDAKDARVHRDWLTAEELSLVKFVIDEQKNQSAIEISFVDDSGTTFVGVLATPTESLPASQAEAVAQPQPAASGVSPAIQQLSSPLRLNGWLTTFEMCGEPLISDQVIQNNASLNLALTMGNHVMVETGFSEMALTNVELETEEATEGTRKVQKPKPILRGAGIVNNFVGVANQDAQGAETFTTPGVHWKESSPITTHRDGKELAYRNILEEVSQLHALISGDAATSGESRKQALTDFISRCLDFKEEIDAAGAWLCEVALLLAAGLIGQADKYLPMKVVFDSKIFVGDLTVEEQTAVLSQVEKKVRSRKSARAILGIPDNDAEEEQIKRETESAPPAPNNGLPAGQGNPKPGNTDPNGGQ